MMLVQQYILPNKSLVDCLLLLPAFLGVLPKTDKKEEVENSLLGFPPDHRDIMMGSFIATLLPLFKVVDTKEKETNNNNTNNKRTTKKRKSNKKKEKCKKLMAESVVTNEQQCADFKLKPTRSGNSLQERSLTSEPNSTAPSCVHTGTRAETAFKTARTEPGATLLAPRSRPRPNKLTLSG
jgi:hypothetical protein